MELVFGKVEKHCGEGENAGCQYFLLSHNVFIRLRAGGRKHAGTCPKRSNIPQVSTCTSGE